MFAIRFRSSFIELNIEHKQYKHTQVNSDNNIKVSKLFVFIIKFSSDNQKNRLKTLTQVCKLILYIKHYTSTKDLLFINT